MAYQTMDRFTDDLLKEKIFNCKVCNELCTSAIFLVNGKGNVCGKCFEEKCEDNMKSRAELNTALMLIIAKLMLPCKFKSKGCDKRVKSNMYAKHMKSCEFKIKPCPMKKLEGCDWSGTNSEQTEHLLKNHDKHVIKGDNNIFQVKTSFSEPFSIKILSFDCQHYLLRTLTAVNKWYYALSPLFKRYESSEYSVAHKSVATSNNSKLKTIGTLTNLNGLYNEFNLNKNPNATVVDIDSIKHLIDEENMILNIFNLNPKGLDENILKLLECPVCMDIIRPPIYQCNRGHNICNPCRQKVFKCPTCRGEWTDVRNLFIENITTALKYPCKFKQFGCNEIGIQSEITKHEEMCLLKILKCKKCMNTMRPPIFSCNSGHSVCFSCQEIDNKCPTCTNEEWLNVMNDALESLTVNVKYPCKYKKLGCNKYEFEKELVKHEEICNLGVEYKCPMLCNKSGNFEFIVKHLNDAHKDMEYHGGYLKSGDKDEIKWIMYDSKLFRFSYHYNNMNGYCAVELVCSKENPDLYRFAPILRSTPCYKESNQPLFQLFSSYFNLPKNTYFLVSINKNIV